MPAPQRRVPPAQIVTLGTNGTPGVDYTNGWLSVGDRNGGYDYSKGRVAFKVPFADALRPLLRACVAGRAEGPLFRSRAAWEGRERPPIVDSHDTLQKLYQDRLRAEPAEVQTVQERKALFRRLLRSLGGGSTDRLAGEFKAVLQAVGLKNGATLYTLRHSTTTAMHRAGVSHLDLRYLTDHSTRDILAEYTALDPVAGMR